MNMLSDSELLELTRSPQAAKQRRVLDDNGIYYIRRADGSIITTWHHVNHPCGKQLQSDDMPNFGAMANG